MGGSGVEWLGELMERRPDPIVVLGPDDRVEWVNGAGQELARRRGIALEAAVVWEAAPELHDQGLAGLVARVRQEPSASDSATVRVRGEDTAEVWYEVRAVETGGWVTLEWLDVTARMRDSRAEADRRRCLAALNRALMRALDAEAIVAAIVEHALPLLDSDGLILHDLTGPHPRLMGLHGHDDPAFLADLDEMDWSPRLEGASQNASEPLFFPSVDALMKDWPQLLPLVRSGGKKAWAVIPLMVSRQEFGVAVFTWGTPRAFTSDDRYLLGTIGASVAFALRVAHTLQQARRRAERLERELLPGPLPDPPGIHAAVRYRTAAVPGPGGHWYDLAPLSGGRALLVVGEVVTSPDDTVAMGILRQLVLTMGALDMPPDDVLAHVGDVATRLGQRLGGQAVTAAAVLAVVDPTTSRCTVTSAGHTPPVVMLPGRPPSALDMPIGDLLGVAQVPAQTVEMELPPGTVLVLASGPDHDPGGVQDGLVEKVAHRRDLAPPPPPGPASRAWLEELCDSLAPEEQEEDLTVLALAVGQLPAGHVDECDLPRVPESAKTARGRVADLLRSWDLTDLLDGVELVVSELVGNTVRHASGIGVDSADTAPGTIRLRTLNLGNTVVCEVYDGSASVPQVRHPRLSDEFGRGLQLVALSASTWGTRYTASGKCVWAAVTTP